jgi:hypothetical protein
MAGPLHPQDGDAVGLRRAGKHGSGLRANPDKMAAPYPSPFLIEGMRPLDHPRYERELLVTPVDLEDEDQRTDYSSSIHRYMQIRTIGRLLQLCQANSASLLSSQAIASEPRWL